MPRAVFKYGTGDVLPDGAVYRATETETETRTSRVQGVEVVLKLNVLVWHYYEVDVPVQFGGS